MSIVKTEVDRRIGYAILNRSEKRNALSAEMVSALSSTLDELNNNDNVKVIIIKAEGKVFCSGADLESLKQLQQNSFEENLDDSLLLKDLFLKIYTLGKPVIAQIQGHAIAGGSGLATVCDFSFSVPEAKFGYTEVRIGFVPALVMVFLIRKVGEARARQLLLHGGLITAEDALKAGMINNVVQADDLEASVMAFANELIENNSGNSMAVTKQMIADVQSMSLEEALDFAARKNAEVRESEDCKKGIGAFLNKDKLSW